MSSMLRLPDLLDGPRMACKVLNVLHPLCIHHQSCCNIGRSMSFHLPSSKEAALTQSCCLRLLSAAAKILPQRHSEHEVQYDAKQERTEGFRDKNMINRQLFEMKGQGCDIRSIEIFCSRLNRSLWIYESEWIIMDLFHEVLTCLETACCMSLAVDVSGAPDLDHETRIVQGMEQNPCRKQHQLSIP